jgi:uncharacterized protein (AIM24 family)
MEPNQPQHPHTGEPGSAPEASPPEVEADEEPLSQRTPESVTSGEDFLFHLYRGSELLQDNCISEAKEELERALSMQPRDVEGQGLLGIVYFRLGLYPRAIKIYQDIVEACPAELTPRVNLALCYIKTGQLGRARRELETVISRAPERLRAWGYLGLVFERMGDLHKARAAFEKAKQEHLVRRMDRLLGEQEVVATDSDRPERLEVRQAAADAVAELETAAGASGAFLGASTPSTEPRLGHWRAVEPGEDPIPPAQRTSRANVARQLSHPRTSLPPLSLSPAAPQLRAHDATASELAEASLLLFPAERGVAQPSERCLLVHLTEGFCVRQDAIGALLPQTEHFSSSVVMRRHRGHETSEPMGGHSTPFVALGGRGDLLISTEAPIVAVRVKDGFIYIRETSLLGFEATVRYEHGRLTALGDEAVTMVQLSGSGVAAFERRGRLSSLAVRAERPVVVRSRLVLGWTGRLLTQPVEASEAPNQAHGFVAFKGDGSVFLETARE